MPDDENLNKKLRRLIETVDIANLLTEPLEISIRDVLRVSALELGAREASVLIRDGVDGDLRFLVATGEVASKLLDLKIPAGKGIAGFVMSSGQPMAVSDVGEEATFYAEVDRETGYSTEMILATPLRHNGEMIGVLEYINRSGDTPNKPFTPEEMDKAARFSDGIASLVNAYESAKLFRDLGEKIIGTDEDMEIGSVRSWLGELRNSAEHREMMDLAVLIREIASRGDSERALCREVLESILRFSESRGDTSFLSL
ncbi:MAG TPA: GAF domain-containing protein [Pyrinomonadaceae bacterium]|nr:GAF domain-containing protein [Pyrinomonadaceae bacterium]